MAAFFQSLEKTLLAGLVILVAIIIIVGAASGDFIKFDHAWFTFFMRWLHVLSGVMWIGLLWYFNFVQTPQMPKIEPADSRVAVTKFIAPAALFWFRWGAAATILTGLLLGWMNGYIVEALTFRGGSHVIGIGMWLGIIMAYNVWFIIWPNQKRALGIVSATDEEKANSARVAGMTSRINTMLSIPMLFCMVAAQNAGL